MVERMLTVEEAAQRLRAHQQTVRRWLREGKIKGTMPGGTKLGYRIPESEITRLLPSGPEQHASIGPPESISIL